MNVFGKMAKLQQAMEAVTERLDSLETTSEAGGGLVKVTATGTKQISRIEIDPDLLAMNDREMLEDLLVAAANQALEAAGDLARKHTQEALGRIAPRGMNLDRMFE